MIDAPTTTEAARVLLQCTLPMEPMAEPRADRTICNGVVLTYSPKEARRHRDALAFYLGMAWAQAGRTEPITGPVAVVCEFRLGRPLIHLGTGRNAGKLRPSAAADHEHLQRPDVDNLVKMLFDAITDARIWRDDVQVVDAVLRKRWQEIDAPDPRVGCTHVSLMSVPDSDIPRVPLAT